MVQSHFMVEVAFVTSTAIVVGLSIGDLIARFTLTKEQRGADSYFYYSNMMLYIFSFISSMSAFIKRGYVCGILMLALAVLWFLTRPTKPNNENTEK